MLRAALFNWRLMPIPKLREFCGSSQKSWGSVTLLTAVSPAYPIILPLLPPSQITPKSWSPINCASPIAHEATWWISRGSRSWKKYQTVTLQKKKKKEKKRERKCSVRRGLNKNCKNPWRKAGFFKGNSVLQLLPSHLFTVIPAQARFRIPALQGLRHNNTRHLAFLLLLELITTVWISVLWIILGARGRI